MSKAAAVMSLLSLWVLAAGCESQPTKARVHLRVFEVPTQVLRLHMSDRNPQKLPDSAYYVSVISPNDLNAMLRSPGASPRMLTESTRIINDWPAVADTWVYSPTYAGMRLDTICTGGGAGYLGVREQFGQLEVHLDYLVNHRGPQGQKLVESKIFYEHPYPEGQVLLFHAPANISAQAPLQHVIAFEITRESENAAPLYGTPATYRQPPDVLAYR
jgi:hypothetical protein